MKTEVKRVIRLMFDQKEAMFEVVRAEKKWKNAKLHNGEERYKALSEAKAADQSVFEQLEQALNEMFDLGPDKCLED